MKFFAVVLLFSMSLGVLADLPGEICHDGVYCSGPQNKIWNEFKAGGFFKERSVPGVYSGVCYHNWPYSPTDAHFGVALLEIRDGMIYFGGEMAFFYQSNPYASLNLDSARKEFPNTYSTENELSLFDDYAYLEYSNSVGNPPLKYWFRQSKESNDLYLISHSGGNYLSFCRYGQNTL